MHIAQRAAVLYIYHQHDQHTIYDYVLRYISFIVKTKRNFKNTQNENTNSEIRNIERELTYVKLELTTVLLEYSNVACLK